MTLLRTQGLAKAGPVCSSTPGCITVCTEGAALQRCMPHHPYPETHCAVVNTECAAFTSGHSLSGAGHVLWGGLCKLAKSAPSSVPASAAAPPFHHAHGPLDSHYALQAILGAPPPPHTKGCAKARKRLMGAKARKLVLSSLVVWLHL
eukprot:1160005-Pelagomonas_calceolata.AAC.8